MVGVLGLVVQGLSSLVYAYFYSRLRVYIISIRFQVNIMEAKDSRMRSVNEMLYGMNTIK
jgi:hypothetical protein